MNYERSKHGGLIMTRDEEIRNAIDTTFPIPPSEKGRTYEQALMATGFENGVKWADTHPKSPWISVEEDLPCNHEELIDPNDPNFTVFVLTKWNDDFIISARLIKSIEEKWTWGKWEMDFSIDYWMPIPQLPKE